MALNAINEYYIKARLENAEKRAKHARERIDDSLMEASTGSTRELMEASNLEIPPLYLVKFERRATKPYTNPCFESKATKHESQLSLSKQIYERRACSTSNILKSNVGGATRKAMEGWIESVGTSAAAAKVNELIDAHKGTIDCELCVSFCSAYAKHVVAQEHVAELKKLLNPPAPLPSPSPSPSPSPVRVKGVKAKKKKKTKKELEPSSQATKQPTQSLYCKAFALAFDRRGMP